MVVDNFMQLRQRAPVNEPKRPTIHIAPPSRKGSSDETRSPAGIPLPFSPVSAKDAPHPLTPTHAPIPLSPNSPPKSGFPFSPFSPPADSAFPISPPPRSGFSISPPPRSGFSIGSPLKSGGSDFSHLRSPSVTPTSQGFGSGPPGPPNTVVGAELVPGKPGVRPEPRLEPIRPPPLPLSTGSDSGSLLSKGSKHSKSASMSQAPSSKSAASSRHSDSASTSSNPASTSSNPASTSSNPASTSSNLASTSSNLASTSSNPASTSSKSSIGKHSGHQTRRETAPNMKNLVRKNTRAARAVKSKTETGPVFTVRTVQWIPRSIEEDNEASASHIAVRDVVGEVFERELVALIARTDGDGGNEGSMEELS
ncbi:hypothetical protein K439DRAFT_677344 [Ramaria rubella]|nr:hypothetical protein K439DRAFT_677344 [Ramaria rubella]